MNQLLLLRPPARPMGSGSSVWTARRWYPRKGNWNRRSGHRQPPSVALHGAAAIRGKCRESSRPHCPKSQCTPFGSLRQPSASSSSRLPVTVSPILCNADLIDPVAGKQNALLSPEHGKPAPRRFSVRIVQHLLGVRNFQRHRRVVKAIHRCAGCHMSPSLPIAERQALPGGIFHAAGAVDNQLDLHRGLPDDFHMLQKDDK